MMIENKPQLPIFWIGGHFFFLVVTRLTSSNQGIVCWIHNNYLLYSSMFYVIPFIIGIHLPCSNGSECLGCDRKVVVFL